MKQGVALFGDAPLNPGDPTPLYLRLEHRIRVAIASGRLQPREALPGERDIASTLGVSRVTVRKAIGGLVEAGMLEQRQGSGTFVSPRPQRVEQALSRLTSFTEDMRLRGLAPSIRVLRCEISPPSPQEAMHLRLSPQDKVSRLGRLRLAGGIPMAIELATLPQRFLTDPADVGPSLYATLDTAGLRPVRALQRLSACNLAPDDAALLDVAPGAAALSFERIAFLPDGEPIEFTKSLYRGDAYDFIVELSLGPSP